MNLPHLDRSTTPTHRSLAAFFIPLALQAATQSFTYPLVAMVASRGEGGTLNLAGVAQAQILMFLTGTLGSGLVTSGMVFARSRESFTRFVYVNSLLSAMSAAIAAVMCIPVVSHVVFAGLLGLPLSIESPAAVAFPLTIAINILFYARNPYQVLLYNNGAAGRASAASIGRVLFTLALAPVFCAMGLVGPVWSLVCQAIPIGGEVATSWWFSRPFHAALPLDAGLPATRREILMFNVPLALGGFLMTLSGMMMTAFVARAPQPERMLPAYLLAVGLANPVAYGASRLQAVVLHFRPKTEATRARIFRFALLAGAGCSVLPLVFLIPGLSDWYYLSLQKLPRADFPLVCVSALALVAYPLTVALRAHREGIAAFRRKTSAILSGNVAFLASSSVTAFFALSLGVPGDLIGPLVLAIGNLAGLAAVAYHLRSGDGRGIPVASDPVVGQ